MTKTLSTIEQALRTDLNLRFTVSFNPSKNGFRCCVGTWINASVFEEIELQCSNIGGVLEQLAREMNEKYLTTELTDGLLPHDKS